MRTKITKKKNNIIGRTIIFAILIILIVVIILNVMARYQSDAKTTGEIEVAVYVLDVDYQSMTLQLEDMAPRNEPYEYYFSVSNYDGKKRSDIPLEYTIIIRTTTNIPLDYELYLEEKYINEVKDSLYVPTSAVLNDEYMQDDELDPNATWFRIITANTEEFGYTNKQKNIYKLLVYFPERYITNAEYQNLIEGIEININSAQIVEEETPEP